MHTLAVGKPAHLPEYAFPQQTSQAGAPSRHTDNKLPWAVPGSACIAETPPCCPPLLCCCRTRLPSRTLSLTGDNILFTSYAHFDSPSALWSLGEKKAVKEFLEYVSDKGITAVTRKMWKVPEPKW